MKVWKITAPGRIICEEITDAATPVGFAKVKIVRAGIAISDLQFFRGVEGADYPIVPGHQAIGIISEIATPNDAGLEKGQRVVVSPYMPCGKCLACKDNRPEDCSSLHMMGISGEGLLRDFAVVPIGSLSELPKQIKDDEAIFAEHIGMAMHVFHTLGAKKGDHVAIIGASIIGLILAQIALYYQAIPILVDGSEYHMDAAKETGIYYLINTAKENASEKVRQITGGRGCECVAYLTAANERFQHCLDFAGYGATVVAAGWSYSNKNMQGSMGDILSKRLTLIGVNNAQESSEVAINMLANKAINVLPLLTKVIEFEQVPELFREATDNPFRYNKVIVRV